MFIDFLDRVSELHCGVPPASTTHGVGCRCFPSHPLMKNFGAGVYCFSPRFAKPTASYPPPIFFNGSSYALGESIATPGSQR